MHGMIQTKPTKTLESSDRPPTSMSQYKLSYISANSPSYIFPTPQKSYPKFGNHMKTFENTPFSYVIVGGSQKFFVILES